jgi:cell shape-determining protein MreC
MPDFNPDKESHRDHEWIVHKAVRDNSFNAVKAAGKEMKFNREQRFKVGDEKVAAEIRREYPRDVTVTRVNKYHPADRGHKYFFQVPEMPWKKERQDEKSS